MHVALTRIVKLRRASLLSFAFLSFAACGTVDDPEPLAKEQLSVNATEACAASAASLCARVETCSTAVTKYFFGSRTECEAVIAGACRVRYRGRGATDTPAPCDASAIRCELLERVDHQLSYGGAVLYDLCPVSPGHYPVGKRCLERGDCESGRCGRCGVCERPLPEGARCSRDTACQQGTACARGSCRRGAFEGEACGRDEDCIAELSQRCENSVCVKRPGNAPCNVGGCDLAQGMLCDFDGTGPGTRPATCKAIPIAREGERCDGDVVSISNPSFAVCDGATRCRGSCQRAGTWGEACSDNGSCVRALQCVDGRCGLPLRKPAPRSEHCVESD